MDRREFLKSAAVLPILAMGTSPAIASPGRTRYVYAGGKVPLRRSDRPLLSFRLYRTRHGLVAVRIWEPGWRPIKLVYASGRERILVGISGESFGFDIRDDGLHYSPSPWNGATQTFLRRAYAPGQHPQSQAPSVDIFEVSIVDAVA